MSLFLLKSINKYSSSPLADSPMRAADWREARLSGDGGCENKQGGRTPRTGGGSKPGLTSPAEASADREGQGTPGPAGMERSRRGSPSPLSPGPPLQRLRTEVSSLASSPEHSIRLQVPHHPAFPGQLPRPRRLLSAACVQTGRLCFTSERNKWIWSLRRFDPQSNNCLAPPAAPELTWQI